MGLMDWPWYRVKIETGIPRGARMIMRTGGGTIHDPWHLMLVVRTRERTTEELREDLSHNAFFVDALYIGDPWGSIYKRPQAVKLDMRLQGHAWRVLREWFDD